MPALRDVHIVRESEETLGHGLMWCVSMQGPVPPLPLAPIVIAVAATVTLTPSAVSAISSTFSRVLHRDRGMAPERAPLPSVTGRAKGRRACSTPGQGCRATMGPPLP
jgi:hypothetical protein